MAEIPCASQIAKTQNCRQNLVAAITVKRAVVGNFQGWTVAEVLDKDSAKLSNRLAVTFEPLPQFPGYWLGKWRLGFLINLEIDTPHNHPKRDFLEEFGQVTKSLLPRSAATE